MSVWNDVKLIFSLLFILALAYACIRLLGRRAAGFAHQRIVRVVSALPLGGGNKTLQVVVVDEKTVLLLGVGANIECVGRFDDPELAGKLTAQTTAGSVLPWAPAVIAGLAARLRGRPQDAGTDKGARAGGPDFARMLSSRLEGAMERREDAIRSFERGETRHSAPDERIDGAVGDDGERRGDGEPFRGR